MADEKIIIKINGDTSNLDKNIKKSKLSLSTLKSVASGIGTGIKQAALIGGAAIAGLTAATYKAVSMFREQEQAEIRTRKTIEATGHAAGLTADEIFKMASELQNVTTYGDETIISGQNLLLTFRNIGSDVFPRATEAMLDMSTAMGTDLKSSAIQLGKALNDPVAGISALTRVGITFSDEQKALIKQMAKAGKTAEAQAIILAELENQFGGVSRAATEGTGAFEQTKNIIGDLWEEIGRALIPVIQIMNEKIKESLPAIKEWIGSFQEFIKTTIGIDQADRNLKAVNARIERTSETISRLNKELEETKKANKEGGFFSNIFKRDTKEIESELNKQKTLLAQYNAELDALYEKPNKKSIEAARARNQALDDAEGTALEQSISNGEERIKVMTDLEKRQAEELRAVREEAAIAEEEVRLQKLEQDQLNAELSQQVLESNLTEEQKIRLQAQLNITKDQHKHDKLMAKMRLTDAKNTLEQNRKALEQRLQLRQMYADSAVQIASNLATIETAITGKSSKAMFLIQKAAALAQAYISMQLAAVQALAIPPAPNVALANVAYAVGGTSIAAILATAITGFAKGGLVTGGIPGRDSVPAMLMPGELVVPKENYEQHMTNNGQGQQVEVILTMNDNLVDFVQAELQEREALQI